MSAHAGLHRKLSEGAFHVCRHAFCLGFILVGDVFPYSRLYVNFCAVFEFNLQGVVFYGRYDAECAVYEAPLCVVAQEYYLSAFL